MPLLIVWKLTEAPPSLVIRAPGVAGSKRAKHPWLIAVRERGYTRPDFKRNLLK